MAVTLSDASASGIRPIVVDHHASGARISLLPDGALLLAGDRVEIDIRVDEGARLDLVEPGGTVAFPARGARAWWSVRIEVAAGATLTWAGEPFVVADGADVERSLSVRCAEGARVLLREALVLGRFGEKPGSVRQATAVYDGCGRPVLVEELDLDATTYLSLVSGRRVITSVLCVGGAPDAPAGPDRFDLDVAGAVLWRSLDAHAHEALAHTAWQAACAYLDAPTGALVGE
jgi:urease accessory protein